jgi:hypothetical protein
MSSRVINCALMCQANTVLVVDDVGNTGVLVTARDGRDIPPGVVVMTWDDSCC